MKKLIVTIIVVFAVVLYAQPMPAPIALGPGKTVVKIDNATCEITTTYVQREEKRQLLEQREMFEREIVNAQTEIARIDKILEVFK